MKQSTVLRLVTCVLLASSGLGCSYLHAWKSKAEATDVARIRKERRSDVVGDFDRRHASAQLLAAQEHAERGETEAAERVLRSVIERDPSNVDARLYLGELYWACDDLPEAETQLREALTADANRADVHHLLGIVLDAQDRSDEALTHLKKAVALEPHNKLFQLALDAADGPNS